MKRALSLIVSILVTGLIALPAYAEVPDSDPFITQLMSIQAEVRNSEITLDQAEIALQDLRASISFIENAEQATSLMVALDSFGRDIAALRNRTA